MISRIERILLSGILCKVIIEGTMSFRSCNDERGKGVMVVDCLRKFSTVAFWFMHLSSRVCTSVVSANIACTAR